MTMTRLYLIRHGRPASTWGGADEDPGLDDQGRAQARAVADRLMSLPPGERPVGVVSSPLRRCRETAQPLADLLGIEVVIDPAVGEIPTPADLAAEERPAWLRRSFGGNWSEIVGDIDYDVWRRRAVDSLAQRGGAAVFSHYVAINGVLSTLEGSSKVIVFRPDHASCTTLEAGPEGLRVVERGHEAATTVL